MHFLLKQNLIFQVPKQEVGRLSYKELTLSRANKSIRIFNHVVESLSNGRQPDLNLLEKVGLKDKLKSYPDELSGGQQQRVAIARALVNDPSILFADEPTGNLDVKNSTTVLDLFLTIQQQTGVTMILVTHDKSIAQKTDITYELKNGLLKKIHSKTESTYIPRLVF